MNMIRHVYVEKSCQDHPYTANILERLKKIPLSLIDESQTPTMLSSLPYSAAISEGKHHLVLGMNRGRFLKPCPATREYTCCEYQVLNIGMNCPMDCVYCILQAYLNIPWLSFFVNVENLFRELDDALDKDPNRYWRIGTGEFTDSLALDGITELSKKLVPFFTNKKNAVLELKTKTANIANLKGLRHGGRTIVAWSLNSTAITASEELRAASLDQRIKAAALAAEWGYGLGFHFDPIVFHENWREGYAETIEKVFASVPPERIVWVSMGALRFLPALKPIVNARFPKSRIFHEEFVPCPDGKMRYFHTLREELYRFIRKELLRFLSSKTCVYLCMENDQMWRRVFGFAPYEQGGLGHMLHQAAETVLGQGKA